MRARRERPRRLPTQFCLQHTSAGVTRNASGFAGASALAFGLRRAIAAVPTSAPLESGWRTAPQRGVASVTAGQQSVLTGQLSTFSSEPVVSQLIISNRSARRLETRATSFASTKLLVLIDTNSDTKFRPATPPALHKRDRKIACCGGCVFRVVGIGTSCLCVWICGGRCEGHRHDRLFHSAIRAGASSIMGGSLGRRGRWCAAR
jgi:hypothetical protein